jgi:hypothetical protein
MSLTILVSLFKGCINIPEELEQAKNYRNSLKIGEKINLKKLEAIGVNIHRLTKHNKVYNVGFYYITVDPQNDTIKSIWVQN